MATPIYDLTEWATAQTSPWVPHNAALRTLEAAARGSVADRDLAAPPGSCADGACYLVAAAPTGLWTGQVGKLAVAVGANATNGWLFLTIATEGQILWVEDESVRIQYASGAWVMISLGLTALDDLSDVDAPAPADGEVLTFDAGAGDWVPGPAGGSPPTESIIVACSDETTDLTTGSAKVRFRMPYAFTLTDVRASVGDAPTGADLIVDINEAGVSILSTKLSIDAGEKTSTTATTPAVISDAALADDAEITIDIDQIGSTLAGAGLKVYLIGHQ